MFFNTDLEPYQCLIELEQNGNIQRQMLTAPKIIIIKQITEIARSISNLQMPCRCKVSRTVSIYDQFDGKWLDREYSIEFQNKAYENK